jgi:hypothetical protein
VQEFGKTFTNKAVRNSSSSHHVDGSCGAAEQPPLLQHIKQRPEGHGSSSSGSSEEHNIKVLSAEDMS